MSRTTKKSKTSSSGSDEKQHDEMVHVVKQVPLSDIQDEVNGWDLGDSPKAATASSKAKTSSKRKSSDDDEDDHDDDDGGVPDATKGLGSVIDGVWFNWATDLSSDSYEAVQNGFLAAQLEATKYVKKDANKWKKDDFLKYFQRFQDNLHSTGWFLPASNMTRVKSLGASYTIASEALDLMAALIPVTQEVALLKAGLDAMKKASNGKPLKLFALANTHIDMSSFAIASVRETPVKNSDKPILNVVLGMGYVEGTTTDLDLLFASWKSSKVDMYYTQAQFQLVWNVYDGIKDTLKKKLGDKAKKTVADWKL